MTSFQRIIKYFGIALAVCLTIGIIGAICSVVFGISYFTKKDSKVTVENVQEVQVSESVQEVQVSENVKDEHEGRLEEFIDNVVDNIVEKVPKINVHSGKVLDASELVSSVYKVDKFSSMEIEANISGIYISIGDEYKIETKNVPNTLVVSVEDNRLFIEDTEDYSWINDKMGGISPKIYITVPAGYEAKELSISQGVGESSISDIDIGKLIIEGGTGDFGGKNLKIEEANIEASVGQVIFTNVEIGEADLSGGVGNISIDGKIKGDCTIECGVGSVDLRLIGKREDYSICADGGLGDIRIDNKKYSELEEEIAGKPKLNLEGGVGSIAVEFVNE